MRCSTPTATIATWRASAATSTCPAWAAPGRYSRLLLVGYFEGLDSEREIARRAADSLAIQRFLHVGLEDATPDHSTISRTRGLISVKTQGVKHAGSLSLCRVYLTGEPTRL
jgi:hypothetical protein